MEYVDILIANEDEAKAFTGYGDESKAIKASVVKIRKNYSPIDFPRGSTQPVVSGYALG